MGTAVALPSGLVTFVFTDIEGSTRLLHRLGDRYAGLLERHREILRRSWEQHGGHEVSVTGDATVAVFDRPGEAVAACAEARRRLAEEAWPDGVEVRVRFGVHRGLASPHDGDYVALAAHQAARVMAAAHGGQVLVSEQVAAELDVPLALDLRPLGRFRVRDFDAPVALHELAGSSSPAVFPSPRAVPADGHNLVGRPTETIGRAEIVSAAADQLEPGRVLTLVGPGGVGKTRVATDVGIAVAPKWDDGVWFVDLAGVGKPDLVPAAIADAIGVPADPAGERWDHLLAHLAGRRTLVVLDSCGHLVVTCRELVETLLASADGVAVLATSREPLRVEGEGLWRVPPLGLPAGPSPEEVLTSPAGRLFVERGAAARPGFAVDEGNAAAVAELCRRLDGLPLLIEVAAAHLSAQSPAEILAGLEDRPKLLRAPARAAPDRHSTVTNLLDWSYRLLEPDEQACFRALSIFMAGFSQPTAAAAVAGTGVDPADVPHLVWSLVDRSLVTAELGANDTRYRLLETVRSHGRELLDEHVETGAVVTRLADALLDRVGPWYPTDRRWIGEVGVEVDNLRGLVDLIPADRQEVAQQIACTIARWHDATQSFREGIREVSRYVETLDARTPTRVSLLATLAYLHLRTGDVERARRLTDEAEALQALTGSPDWDDVAVERTRGEIARRAGHPETAVAIAERALELFVVGVYPALEHNFGVGRNGQSVGFGRDDLKGPPTLSASIVKLGHPALDFLMAGQKQQRILAT
jgi:predicted ATPase/class 3 adenylate cyclase